MSWTRQVVATPEGLAAALDALEPPERAGEAAQFEALVAAAKTLGDTVSKREPMMITLSGHTDPNAEGFDARNAGLSMSRIEPDEAKRRATEARQKADEEEEAAAAAAKRAEEAEEAAKRAEEEAGSIDEDAPPLDPEKS